MYTSIKITRKLLIFITYYLTIHRKQPVNSSQQAHTQNVAVRFFASFSSLFIYCYLHGKYEVHCTCMQIACIQNEIIHMQ